MAISSIVSSSVATASSDGARASAQVPSTVSGSGSPPSTTGTGASAQAPSPEQVARAVKQVNDAFSQMGQNLYASIEKDQTTGINVVKFQDRNTQEVVSQYPSKAIIAMAEALGQSQGAKGQLINTRA